MSVEIVLDADPKFGSFSAAGPTLEPWGLLVGIGVHGMYYVWIC